MAQDVAVAVIHGISSKRMRQPADTSTRTFSKGLYNRLRGVVGRKVMAENVTWREIFWADILQERQEQYLDAISDQVRVGPLRKLLVRNFADALAFSRRGTAYGEVLARISRTIADLRADVGEDTPLIILAHSFGCRVMSNYMWDLQVGDFTFSSPFERLETMSKFITFGCPIPLFTFAFPPEEVAPIAFPGPRIPDEPWWLNYYDKNDIIASPLAPAGPKYEQLVIDGQMAEFEVNVGGLFSSGTLLSHEGYWKDRNFVRPVAEVLNNLIHRA